MRHASSVAALLAVVFFSPSVRASPPIPWQDWSDTVFDRARAEGRLVLLDLGAVWCHWCHVMEETTYKDPEVVSLIQTRFVAVRVDQDARPDLLLRAREGDRGAERMARETLDRQLKLIDPVWGGVYQYSDSGDWDHPHFEKIMSMQAEDLRLYAQAYSQLGDARYLQAARDIHKFLTTFLRGPDGAFYVSQDADVVRGEHSGAYFKLGDAERRARGIPRVDTHLYTRETAWAATALLAIHAATGEEAHLRDAATSAEWILANRAIEGGGFRHDAVDVAGPYLGDSVAAARLFLALYAATGERRWLEHGEKTLAFMSARFRREGVSGLVTAAKTGAHDRPTRSATRTSWPRGSRTSRSTSPAIPPTARSPTKRSATWRVRKSRAGSTPAASCSRTGSARAIPCTSPSWAAVPIRSRAPCSTPPCASPPATSGSSCGIPRRAHCRTRT